MINTVVFFGVTLLLLVSLLSEECSVFPWRVGCTSVAALSFSPGSWDSAGSQCVLPKRLRKRSISSSILTPWLAVSGRLASDQTQQRLLTVSVGWGQRGEAGPADVWKGQSRTWGCREDSSTLFHLTAAAKHLSTSPSHSAFLPDHSDGQMLAQQLRNPTQQGKKKTSYSVHVTSEGWLVFLLSVWNLTL